MKRSIMLLVAAFVVAASFAVPAQAAAPPVDNSAPAQDPAGEVDPNAAPLESHGSVVVETYDNSGRLISEAEYGPETEGLTLPGDEIGMEPGGGGFVALASGKGGSSTASGCRRVTVKNETETALGFTAFYFNTWTRWCWTRSSQVVKDVTHGWTITDVDSQFVWRGINNKEFTFYDYSTNDGHPRSAFKHYRQGHFENCIFKYGCLGNYYPANTLRSYYNGTWAWSTSG